MKHKQDNYKKRLPGVLLLAMVTMLLAFLLPAALDADQYYVWGRVYSSYALPDGEDFPPNPLTGVTGSQIIGDNMVPVSTRNLVRVKVLKASDLSELGSFVTVTDGSYFIDFNVPGATVSVKYIVEELLSGEILLDSEADTLNRWTIPAAENNIRYFRVPGGLSDIASDREFAPCPPGKYTAIFTRVGKIEVATEVENPPGSGTFVTQHLIEPTTGLATVPASVATYLGIHPYEDAPLGGYLYMFGAFNSTLYSAGVHYRIRIDKFNEATSTFVFDKYMDDDLVKTKYVVDLWPTITVTATREKLGPFTVGATDNCYQLTPLSTGNTFWSFPDLLALWRTSSEGLNGKYRATLEVVGLAVPADFIAAPNYTDLTMTLDNVRPVAEIQPLFATAGDTPMVYTPGPAVTSNDLLPALLGSTTDYGPTANPICSIFDLTNPGDHVAFKLKAYHDSGYMRYWYFKFRRNDTGYTTVIGKKYSGGSMVDLSPVPPMKISSTQTDVKGFQDKFQYLNPGLINLGNPDGCAYRFVIGAATRTTDGYHYLYYSSDEDLHYIRR